jgi:endonuclease/exonuclease/phosphatase family metal-dependent hydrolase
MDQVGSQFAAVPVMRAAFIVCAWSSIAGAMLSCGGGPSAPSPFAPSGNATRAPTRFTVMTFNIQHGIDGSGRYGLRRAVETIARIQPDIVGLQEVTRNHPAYNCEDQPALLASGVSGMTGALWTAAYQQEWFTTEFTCRNQGRGDGSATEGLVWMTRHAASPLSMVVLADSRLLLHTSVPALGAAFTVTHLDSGADHAAIRSQQIDRLLSWSAGAGEPRIVVGDFNMRPEEPDMQRVFAVYRDAWTEAVRLGRAAGDPATHRSSRIDYVLFAGSGLTVESVETVNTAALIGADASDHRPLIATFTLR